MTTTTTELKPFRSAWEYNHHAAILNDRRLYPMTNAIHRCFDPIRKPVVGTPELLQEMRRLGLIDDTCHLSPIGVDLWNGIHS